MLRKLMSGCAGLAVFQVLSLTVRAANVVETVTYQSSITSDAQGALDLKMEANYNTGNTAMPIVVVMHQFSQATGNFTDYRANAQRLRDQGFFVLTIAMRGREGSDGVRDSGGLEIYDIYDGIEYAKAHYGALVDPTNVSITGYSGGGGNVMSAITKFPDYFRAASSFFGMSDYGYDPANGWYQNGASSSHRTILNADIGNPTGGSVVTDRYMARASNLASQNNPYTEIHLFVNGNEAVAPPINDTSYKAMAEASAEEPGEFDNITVHIGQAGTYHDFNGNSVNESNEQQYWPHQAPTADQQAAAEKWYADRLLDGSIPEPVLHGADELFVAGFVKTRAFEAWLGDGQNAAGRLGYTMGDGRWEFTLDILSSNAAVTGWIEVDLSDYAGATFDAFLNDELVESFTGADSYRVTNFGEGDHLVIQTVPEPSTWGLLGVAFAFLGWKSIRSRPRRIDASQALSVRPEGRFL